MTPDLDRGAAVGCDAVDIDDAERFTAEQFRAVTDGYRNPVVMRGLCTNTEGVSNWTLSRLLGREEDRVVAVEHYAAGDKREPYELREMRLGDLAAAFERGEHENWYLASLDFDQTFPSAVGEMPPLRILPNGARSVMRSVFFGVNTASATHFHTRDLAVLVQIRGDKRVILAEPSAPLATNPTVGPRPQYSTYGPDSGEDAAAYFTELIGDRAIVVDLSAGDALFIPVHWWHWVESREESLSVTTFWRAPYRNWTFPRPGFRALTAIGISVPAGLARRAGSFLRAKS